MLYEGKFGCLFAVFAFLYVILYTGFNLSSTMSVVLIFLLFGIVFLIWETTIYLDKMHVKRRKDLKSSVTQAGYNAQDNISQFKKNIKNYKNVINQYKSSAERIPLLQEVVSAQLHVDDKDAERTLKEIEKEIENSGCSNLLDIKFYFDLATIINRNKVTRDNKYYKKAISIIGGTKLKNFYNLDELKSLLSILDKYVKQWGYYEYSFRVGKNLETSRELKTIVINCADKIIKINDNKLAELQNRRSIIYSVSYNNDKYYMVKNRYKKKINN